MSHPATFACTLATRVDAVDPACADLRRFLEARGAAAAAFTVELLAREFIVNAIRHGNLGDPRKRVDVRLFVGRRWITLEITDQGAGFDWREVRRRGVPDDHAEGGRGLAIGAEFAQSLRYNRRGNRVTLRVSRPPQPEV